MSSALKTGKVSTISLREKKRMTKLVNTKSIYDVVCLDLILCPVGPEIKKMMVNEKPAQRKKGIKSQGDLHRRAEKSRKKKEK